MADLNHKINKAGNDIMDSVSLFGRTVAGRTSFGLKMVNLKTKIASARKAEERAYEALGRRFAFLHGDGEIEIGLREYVDRAREAEDLVHKLEQEIESNKAAMLENEERMRVEQRERAEADEFFHEDNEDDEIETETDEDEIFETEEGFAEEPEESEEPEEPEEPGEAEEAEELEEPDTSDSPAASAPGEEREEA